MAISTIQLVDTDLSTVLFDLHSSDGSTNASWGSVVTKFGLGGSFTTTAPHEAGRFDLASDGAFTTFSRRGLGTASWRQSIAGTTEANLRLGVGRLTDLITRGTILRVVTSTTTRYLRIEPSGYPSPYQGKELELHDIFQQFAFRQGLDVSVAVQPYWEGAEVTTSGITVPNDPATSTKVRVYPLTVSGDLPTPGRVKIHHDTGGTTVGEVRVAWRSRGTRASSYFADYLSDTGFLQCEATGRGWTITLSTDTAGAIDANASPGSGTSVARCTYATQTAHALRLTATRTTKLDSLRGSWDVWLRCKASAAAVHTIQLTWGPGVTGGSTANAIVTHDTSAASAFGYVELNLGRISIPEDPNVTLSGYHFLISAGRTSGTGNLDMDLLWLVPALSQTSLTTAIAGTLSTNESMLTDPGLSTAYQLSTTGAHAGELRVEGAIPALLDPGDNHLMVRENGPVLANYSEYSNVLSYIATVTVFYFPRFPL